VAGPVHPFAWHQAYFHERIEPLLDEKRQYIGHVGLSQKIDLLGRAKCILAPSSVAETSSLVSMEALASGTPVIAYRSGALPEIVEEGVTGYVVDSEEEMAAAVERIEEISNDTCRAAAVTRFDANHMVRHYVSLYERLRLSSKRQRRIG
jgi:glycosyltransferase involved in cell wall biosynthesis